MSPFTNTTLQWLPGEPNDSGFCAYLERAEVAGLKANPCTNVVDGLVCEKPVGKKVYYTSRITSEQLPSLHLISCIKDRIGVIRSNCWTLL